MGDCGKIRISEDISLASEHFRNLLAEFKVTLKIGDQQIALVWLGTGNRPTRDSTLVFAGEVKQSIIHPLDQRGCARVVREYRDVTGFAARGRMRSSRFLADRRAGAHTP